MCVFENPQKAIVWLLTQAKRCRKIDGAESIGAHQLECIAAMLEVKDQQVELKKENKRLMALAVRLKVLAKQATNGWACYAWRKMEHEEISRLHQALDAIKVATPSTIGATECVMGSYCYHHGFVHGAEAEELREAFERFIKFASDYGAPYSLRDIQNVLDSVDARDSVATLEERADQEIRAGFRE